METIRSSVLFSEWPGSTESYANLKIYRWPKVHECTKVNKAMEANFRESSCLRTPVIKTIISKQNQIDHAIACLHNCTNITDPCLGIILCLKRDAFWKYYFTKCVM